MNQTLNEFLKSKKMSQKDLAEQLGVAQSLVSLAVNGSISESLQLRIEDKFKIKLIIEKKSSEAPAWFEEMKLMWKEEIEFLKVQIERKDRMLDAMTEKLVKVEVANWPPMHPVMGGLGLATEVQLRAA